MCTLPIETEKKCDSIYLPYTHLGYPSQQRHELAAVAHAEREGVAPVLECLELLPYLRHDGVQRSVTSETIEAYVSRTPVRRGHQQALRSGVPHVLPSLSKPTTRATRHQFGEGITSASRLITERRTTHGVARRKQHAVKGAGTR